MGELTDCGKRTKLGWGLVEGEGDGAVVLWWRGWGMVFPQCFLENLLTYQNKLEKNLAPNAISHQKADEAAVVEHQAGRTWIVRARVEVVEAHPRSCCSP